MSSVRVSAVITAFSLWSGVGSHPVDGRLQPDLEGSGDHRWEQGADLAVVGLAVGNVAGPGRGMLDGDRFVDQVPEEFDHPEQVGTGAIGEVDGIVARHPALEGIDEGGEDDWVEVFSPTKAPKNGAAAAADAGDDEEGTPV